MATSKKKAATKKAPAKKAAAPKENLPALIDSGLNSAALAAHANYDVTEFAGIALDVNENSELFQNDILIPKIWLIQSMSELRKQKKADEGQFVDSQTAELLADEGEELNFVVLKTFKRWHTFKMVDGKKVFDSSDIMVFGKNHNLPYEETVDGVDYKRRQVISAYVLIERDAVRGMNKPYIIDFASSSKYGGRKMISDIKTLGNEGLPPFVAFFKMTSAEENFADGSAFVKDVNFGGYLPKASIPFLVKCRKDLDTMEDQIEIDDSDVIDANKSGGKKAQTNVNENADQTQAGI